MTLRTISRNPLAASVLLLTAAGWGTAIAQGGYDDLPDPRSIDFSFSDPARGGTLELAHRRNELTHMSVAINTVKGQTPDEVRAAFRNALLAYPLEDFLFDVIIDRDGSYPQRWQARSVMCLPGLPGGVVLGGTETGLGILPPVGSLSARFDSASNRHAFRWHEKSDYTEVYVCGLGGGGIPVERGQNVMLNEPFGTLPGDRDNPWRHGYFYVVGFKDGLPTNASYIFASDTEQIEYFYHPFTNGIVSNWTGWRLSDSVTPLFEEKIYPDMEKVSKSQAADTGRKWEVVSRCAQLIRSEKQEGHGGMYRFFIAQTPGRVYRPALRCHIMEEAEDFKGEWAFEVMTGVIDPGRAYEMDYATRVLNGDYWTEFEANGEQISKWRFEHTMERADNWIMNQTGAQDSDIPQKDIVLGDSKTAVFFCVRLTGHKPNGIAMDGVRLVDVTDGFVNAHTRERFL